MSIEAMKQALKAMGLMGADLICEAAHHGKKDRHGIGEPCHIQQRWHKAFDALRTAIAESEKQEPVACRTLCELCVKRGYDFCANAAKTTPIITTPPAAPRQPLIDSVRQMRDVQGMDGTWNCDPYMHGLYNGLEFAVSLLEQREPQFRDAPKKWLNDLPKPRIFSATEAAHGIGEKK